MDSYFRYNKITMYDKDRDIITFTTKNANYIYIVMPLGLKNAEGIILVR